MLIFMTILSCFPQLAAAVVNSTKMFSPKTNIQIPFLSASVLDYTSSKNRNISSLIGQLYLQVSQLKLVVVDMSSSQTLDVVPISCVLHSKINTSRCPLTKDVAAGGTNKLSFYIILLVTKSAWPSLCDRVLLFSDIYTVFWINLSHNKFL